ncbi:MAG: hypothetical protein VX843_00660 [Actinomycetota bacterium]|nr:hypothetical protein [Actinomycetota bacterium]
MTNLDREESHTGYWQSSWPVECGGNRRQKSTNGALNARTKSAQVISKKSDRWNVMAVERDKGEWYLGGTMPAFTGPPPFGWVQKIDLSTLEPIVESEKLPCGEHVWCGAILVHSNGSVMSINGSYLHRLSPTDLSVEAELELPIDRAHNGLLALSDGSLITKDLRIENEGRTTITRICPESLEVLDQFSLPEGSMGRIAADIVTRPDGSSTEYVYVPGISKVWRLVVEANSMTIDDWQPNYRLENSDYGLAWDSCISGGSCWIMDCGDIQSVRAIHTTEPNGRFITEETKDRVRRLSWRLPAPWSGAQRLIEINLDNPNEIRSIEPFGTPGGGIIAPPVYIPELEMAVAWDSINGGLAGISSAGENLEMMWHLDIRPTMQPLVFPESKELVINDFVDNSDDLIVVDIQSGELIDRVPTGSSLANGMFLSPTGDGGVIYCTTTTVSVVSWV